MSNDFNVNHISYRFFGDKLTSLDLSNNLIIESSDNNIELKTINKTISFNNNTVFNYGLALKNNDLSNIINITGKILNIDTLFVTDTANSQANIDDYGYINNGYIRATTIGYNPAITNSIIGSSIAYFTYIDVSGGDSSFNNSVYIKNSLDVSGATTISNDLIVNGTSYVTLYNAISSYISNIKEELSSNKILTLDLSATNISVSNELVVRNTSFLNNISISGLLLDSVLKVPHDFTIQPIVPIVYNFDYYSWTTINSSYTGFWRSVCWSPLLGMFVSVIFNNNNYYVLYSYNGKGWFPGTPSSYNARSGVCWSQERSMFVAVGYELMYSYDGITWSSTNVSGVDASISWNAPCWSPELSMFVASSNGGTSSNSNVMYSYNGINWTQTSQIIPNNSWSTPCWSPHLRIFVAVAQSNTNNVMYSDDGKNWTLKTATANYYFKSVCWSAELVMFVAVAQSASNNVMYSYDGIDWTTITFGTYWSNICWSAQLGIFLAMTSYGSYKVMYSYDGINWSQQNIVTPENGWSSICWSPELKIFVGVGNTSNVMISSLPDRSNSGTLIINGDLIVYGNKTTIGSNIVEISDITLSVATNLINANDLYNNQAGLDISNVASIKYDGTNWNFNGGQVTVENKNVCLDVSLIALKTSTDTSLNSLNSYFDLSYIQLVNNNDNSYNATYSRTQIDASFILKSDFEVSYNSFITYLDNSYVKTTTFDASFSSLKTYLDASYILKSTSTIINSIDLSLNSLRDKLDLSYVLKSTFESSYNSLKEQIEISFGSIRLTSLDTSSISVETINTKHSSQRFNNILWNQIGLDISNGPPLINNNKKVAMSNDGKVVALSSSSHSDVSKGRIYVYELSYNQASYNWRQLGLSSEILVGVSNDDQFGWDIALSSNGRVVAGSSINSDASGINSGQVRIFELSNNNVWRQKGLNINGPRAASESGYSISLAGNGNSIAIGAWKDNSNGTNAGAVRVYDFSSNIADWRQKGQTIAGVSGSFEGYATALSLDGQTLASASILEASRNIISFGGTVSIIGEYIIHSFTNLGTSTFRPSFSGSVEVLIVGGGGGGGGTGFNGSGGGGGAGGVVYIPSVNVSADTSYSIFVGDGGTNAANGQNTTAFTAIAAGGGYGGVHPTNGTGNSGGSGGGGGGGNIVNIGGTSSGNSKGTNSNAIIHGNNGGSMTHDVTFDYRGAGGGGAGTQGFNTNTNSTENGGQFGFSSGGDGIMYDILGTNYYWAGGGGGGGRSSIGGWGGRGGGGGGGGAQGSNTGGPGGGTALNSGGGGGTATYGGPGGANTGGGGGGGSYTNAGGKGGSGIVVIRYLASNITRGIMKTFTISGTTWIPKGNIPGFYISFGRAIKLSANGNTIVIGAPISTISSGSDSIYGWTYNVWTNDASTGLDPSSQYTVAVNLGVGSLATTVNQVSFQAHALSGTNFSIGGAVKSFVSPTQNISGAGVALASNFISDSTNRTVTLSNLIHGATYKTSFFSMAWDANFDTVRNQTFTAVNGPSVILNPNIYEQYIGIIINCTFMADNTGSQVFTINSFNQTFHMYALANRLVSIPKGTAWAYGFQGGTTWTQLGQAIQGISGGDEFGSNVSISNDGTIIAIGSDNNTSNRGQVRVFVYANNYWNQVSNAIDGKTASSKAGIHALSGDGTTLIQSNNTYNSVYGINKTLAVNAPMTSISGNLLVLGNISVNSLDISSNHSYATNGYSYKMFGSDLSNAIMKEYYSDVISARHLKVQITGNGYITNRNNSYRALSDSRLKENIQDSGPKLEDLLKVRIVDYTMKGSNNTKYIGVLAQELEGVFPNLVTELEPSPKDIQDGNTIKYKAVNYSSFDALLIKSLQEQNAMLKNIEKRIIALEDEFEDN